MDSSRRHPDLAAVWRYELLYRFQTGSDCPCISANGGLPCFDGGIYRGFGYFSGKVFICVSAGLENRQASGELARFVLDGNIYLSAVIFPSGRSCAAGSAALGQTVSGGDAFRASVRQHDRGMSCRRTVGYGIWHADRIETVSCKIEAPGKKKADDLHIVLISDLHLGAVTSEQKLEGIVERINEMDPDMICVAGDIFDSDYGCIEDPEKASSVLKRLTAKYGVYCCPGNHDAGATFGLMEDFLEKSDIRCLNEEMVNIDDRMVLVGRVDSSPIGGQGSHVRQDTEALLEPLETDLPVAVIDHNPANLSQYTEKADLVLCGHTHHGQVWPANPVTAYGYYPEKNGTPQAFVTSGVGVWGMPMRIGSGCEIVSIRLS